MRQQINLYQDILIDKSKPLQHRQAVALLFVIVCCLGLLFAYSSYKANDLAVRVKELRHNTGRASTQLAALQEQYPEPQKSVLLEEKVRRLERDIENSRSTLKFFDRNDDTSNARILESLEGLARHPFAGLWLHRIRLYDGGAGVQLSGSAVRADRVPDYLALLGEENILGGKLFSRLKVERLDDNDAEKQRDADGRVDFVLESALEKNQ
ncbi:MAG: hypothetical protein ABR512_14590 [Desulfopila sp.]